MKILNFGSCNIDYVYYIDHITAVGETQTINRLEIFPGGKGLNQSIAAVRAGAEVYHIGCVGNDGKMLTDILEKSGADTTYLKNVNEKNGHAIIQVSADGENCIFICPGSNERITKELIDAALADFGADDIVLLQNEISNTDYVVKKAYEKKMRIVFNPSPFNEKISKIDLNMISYLVLNEVEIKYISGCDNYGEGLSRLKRNYPKLKVILTLGKKGCIYADSEQEKRQSAFCVKSVDTTAAGDTFTGYFAAGIAAGDSIADILKTASAASAISVSKHGAAPSIPDRAEVETKMAEMKEYDCESRDRLLKRQIERYISENPKTASLEELSERLQYSKVYTGNLVKKLSGKTFSELVKNMRCAAAAKLLENTDIPIGEIIAATGYENETFFRKIFREKYGVNPGEYRKKRRL